MSDLISYRVSRRTLLAGAAAIGAVGAFSLPTPTRAAGARTLRIASGEGDGVKGTLDPAFGKNDPDSARISLVFERLVSVDESFVPVPQLATEWSSDSAAKVWTFKLRPDVVFHDGTPLTAKDVIFSYRRLLDPKLGSPATAILAPIDPDGIEAVDDHTVAFHLKETVVEFPLLIANRFTYIVRAGQPPDELRTAGIGTGAFKVERYVPGEEPSLYLRNDRYWRLGRPGVDRVELRSIPEESARVAALLANQIDLTWDLPLRSAEKLKNNPAVKVISARTPFWYGLAFWSDTPPFDDVRVRQALKLVADRKQLLKAVLAGHGSVANDTPVAPWLKYGIQEPAKAPDIEKARALLAEAGHKDGLDLELYTSEATSGLVELATVYKAQAEKAGIRIKIIKAPADDYWANIWLKKPFIATAWSGRAADEALSLPFLSTGDWNEGHWRSKAFDNALFEARKSADETKRAELYLQAQRLLQSDSGTIIALFADAVGATRADITGWSLHPQKISQDFSGVTFVGS